jgi:hypothetical protein
VGKLLLRRFLPLTQALLTFPTNRAITGEWPRVGNGPSSEIRNNPSSLVEKNGADSLLLIFYVEGRHSFRSHRCE